MSSNPVISDTVGIELAKALGIQAEYLVGFELKVQTGQFVRVVADYEIGEEAFSKFFTLCNKFVAKEDTDVNDPE